MGETTEIPFEEKVESCLGILKSLKEMERKVSEFKEYGLIYRQRKAETGYKMIQLSLRRYSMDVQREARKRLE